MKYLKIIPIIMFTFLLGVTLKADFNSKGKEFWLSFMPNFHNNAESADPELRLGDSLYIFINSEKPTTGKITYTDRYGIVKSEDFAITDINDIYTFKVSWYDYEIWGFNFHSRAWSNYQTDMAAPQSFHIVTEEEVTVYAHSQAVTTSDAFLVLPADVLGQEYFVLSYNADGRSYLNYSRTPSQFLIVGTEDQTTIEIITPVSSYLYPAGTRSIKLNKGQSYLVQTKFDAGSDRPDLTGSHILSDKPIAVFSGHQRSTIPIPNNETAWSRDCLIEQIPPVTTWGKNALLVPIQEPNDYSTRKGSLYRILASRDSTVLTINDNIVTTLNKGEFYQADLDRPLDIVANHPILAGVFKYSAGQSGVTFPLADPFIILIPPQEQFIRQCKVINVQAWEKNSGDQRYYPVYGEHFITIVAPATGIDSVYIDGQKLDENEFIPIHNGDYTYIHTQVSEGIHDIASKEPVGVYIYGYGPANSYGYTGGMELKTINLGPPIITFNDSCFSVKGMVRTADSVERKLTQVKVVDGTTDNTIVNIDDFTDKYAVEFSVTLINNRLDGSLDIEATDNNNQKTTRKIEVPGLTLAASGYNYNDPLPVIIVNAKPTGSAGIIINNYGNFNQQIINVFTANDSLGQIQSSPTTLAGKQTDTIVVEYTITDGQRLSDTLHIETKCGTIAIAIINVISDDCDPSAFEFLSFTERNKLFFNGKANISNDFLRLTNNDLYKAGSVWYHETVPVLDGFTTEFEFRFSDAFNYNCDDGSNQGADGLAFVIQNAGTAALGFSGGGIGYEGIFNSIAIEFDTYNNDKNQIENYFDSNGHHIAVNTQGTNLNSAKHKDTITLAINSQIDDWLTDGTTYHAKIQYSLKNKTLIVYMDTVPKPQKEVLKLTDFSIGQHLVLDRGYRAYVGFTAATGCAVQNHDILSWSFCPEFPNPETDIDENDISDINNDLIQVMPNPFNFNTKFGVQIDESSKVELYVIDLLGYRVSTIYSGQLTQGKHYFDWIPTQLDRGMYFIVLETISGKSVSKVVYTY